MHDKQQWIGTLISFGILLIVLTLRMRRMRKAEPLRVERLWILPGFYGLVVVSLFVVHPPTGMVWLYCALGLAVGIGLGWYRGKLMHISVDPDTHEVIQQSSMAAMLFIFLLVGLRYATRSFAAQIEGNDPEALLAVTDVMLVFGFGFIAAQRVEIGLRARALIAQAKARAS